MTSSCRLVLVGLCAAACTFGSDGTMKASSATLGSQDEGGSGEGDGEDGSGAAQTDTSDGATSTSSPPPPPMTSGPPEGSSDDAPSGESSGPMVGDGSDSGEPPPPNPYSDCDLGCPDASACSYGACSQPCQFTGECPPPPSGTAIPYCPAPYYYYCTLDCEGGLQCPDGMTCIGHEYGWSCGYP